MSLVLQNCRVSFREKKIYITYRKFQNTLGRTRDRGKVLKLYGHLIRMNKQRRAKQAFEVWHEGRRPGKVETGTVQLRGSKRQRNRLKCTQKMAQGRQHWPSEERQQENVRKFWISTFIFHFSPKLLLFFSSKLKYTFKTQFLKH